MITLKDIDLNGAYEKQQLIVPFCRENQGFQFAFEVDLNGTYAKGYKLYVKFEDEEGEYTLDSVVPSGWFSKTELQTFESLVFGKAVKEELAKQKKQISAK